MTPAARAAAAIEVLADIAARHRPAADALKDWGLSHRFAGSGDRAAIAGLVYDALRRKASAVWIMGADTPRAVLLGALRLARALDVGAIAAMFDGARHAPDPLTAEERERLAGATLNGAPAHVAGDYPEWLDDALAARFGDDRAEEGQALAARAPLDLRVNTLKATRAQVLAALAHLDAAETRWSEQGLRIALSAQGKSPPVQAEPAFIKGLFEIQDEGSQLAATLAVGDAAGGQMLDLCAGGGGKTLALAALADNRGQIFAYDQDQRRLAPIHDRLARAGTRNVQVRTPRGKTDVLADLAGRMDLVMLDAPCTGTGTWRRNPDAKWRLRPGALEQRKKEQAQLLDNARRFVRAGGRVAYITCSLLPAENEDQIQAFLTRHAGWRALPPAEVARAALGDRALLFLKAVRASDVGLLMTPARTDTDGFFVSILQAPA